MQNNTLLEKFNFLFEKFFNNIKKISFSHVTYEV